MRQRPWLTLSTVATLTTVLGVLAGALTYIVGYFETSADAKAEARRNATRDAWAAYGIADLRRTLARNRVWECDAMEQRQSKQPLVPAEVVACKQYRRDFDAADARANQLFNEAMSYGKEP